jgi:hypothetical protein
MGEINRFYLDINDRFFGTISDFVDDNIVLINYSTIETMCPRMGHDKIYWKFRTPEYDKSIIDSLIDDIKSKTNKVIIFSPEEINFNVESVKYFVDNALKCNIKIFIYSFSSHINEYLKNEYPNYYNKLILANSAETLLTGKVLNYRVIYDYPNYIKDIKLLFLNYNRKINRDLIISYLNKVNELNNIENFISYHNYHTFNSNDYYKIYKEYSEKNNIDFTWLKTLNLSPENVDIHNQGDAQYKAQLLHHRAKFNIICEPFFGMSDNPNEFEYYNHTISRKTIYPIFYKNVIYVHSHNNLLKDTLQNLGFETFFDNIDDFINNMTDEFYYSENTQKKLEHNYNKIIEYMGNIERARTHLDHIPYRKLTQEITDFIGKK